MTALSLWQRRRLGLSPKFRALIGAPNQLQGLEFWYDAAASPVIESGGVVERLDDLSGNANHAAQTTPAARPLRTVDGAGRAVIRFDGSDDVLAVASPPDLAAGVTVFLVFRMRSRTDFGGVLSAAASAGTDHVDFFTFQNGSAASETFQLFGRSTESDPLLWQSSDDGGLFYGIFALGDGSGHFRSLAGSATDSYDGAFGIPDEINLGARYNSGVFGHAAVDLIEIGLYSRTLGKTQLDALEGYLRARYEPELGVLAEVDFTDGPTMADLGPDWTFARASTGLAWHAGDAEFKAFASGALRATDLGVLIEPAATNSVVQSNNLPSWAVAGGMAILTAAVTAPLTSTVGKLAPGPSATNARARAFPSGAPSSGAYTISAIVKAAEWPWVRFVIQGTGISPTPRRNFDITSLVMSDTGGTTDGGFIDLGDGWYRIWTTLGSLGSPPTEIEIRVGPNGSDWSGAAGDGSIGLYMAQVDGQDSALVLSPIPTAGAAVTRAADRLDLAVPGVALGELGLQLDFRLPYDGADHADADLRLFGSNDTAGSADELRTAGAPSWAWVAATGGGNLQVAKTDLVADTEHTLGLSLTDAEQVAVLDGTTRLDDSQSLNLDHSDIELQLGHWGSTYTPMWLERFSYWIRGVTRGRIE